MAAVVAGGTGAGVAAAATSPTTAAPTPAPTTATPGSTLPAPTEAPFDQAVGGGELGVVGLPLSDPASPAPAVDAQAWIVADAETGDVLGALSPHVRRPPASTIKLLTAISALPEIDDDADYVATDADASIEGSRVGLAPGQTYSVDDILHGLMLASGNDAAHALGELAGGQESVVRLMNDEARRIGAFDTHAVTPHGLDDPAQLSSAYDLALIGRAALEDERVAELAATTEYAFPGLDGATFQIQNQNRLLGSYDGAIGLKTGYTTNGGHTLVAAAERGDRTLIVVVLGADGRAEDSATTLLDWGFAAPNAAPVGELVTPEDVTAAVEARDAADSQDINPFDDYDDVLRGNEGTSGNVPPLVWIILAVAVVAGALGFAVRRRPKQGGRYASSRKQ